MTEMESDGLTSHLLKAVEQTDRDLDEKSRAFKIAYDELVAAKAYNAAMRNALAQATKNSLNPYIAREVLTPLDVILNAVQPSTNGHKGGGKEKQEPAAPKITKVGVCLDVIKASKDKGIKPKTIFLNLPKNLPFTISLVDVHRALSKLLDGRVWRDENGYYYAAEYRPVAGQLKLTE
jgi:hypothetical protein